MKNIIRSTNDLCLGLLMGGLGVFLLVSKKVVTGNSNGMGGFWAQASTYIQLLAVILVALAVLQLIYAFNFKAGGEHKGLSIPVNREIAIVGTCLILYAILLPKLTFFPCTLALSIITCGTFQMKENSGVGDGSRKLSRKQIISNIIYSVILTIALYVVFTKLLKCVLP